MSTIEHASGDMCRARYTGIGLIAPGLLTGITGGITFSRMASACRVTVALAVAGKLQVTVDDGATKRKHVLKDDVALPAGSLQKFTFGVRATKDGLEGGAALTYDFELLTDGAVDYLLIEEVAGAVI